MSENVRSTDENGHSNPDTRTDAEVISTKRKQAGGTTASDYRHLFERAGDTRANASVVDRERVIYAIYGAAGWGPGAIMVAKRKAPYPPRQLRRGTVDYGVTHVELDDGQLYWREHATLTPGKVVRLSGNERKVLGEAYSFAVDEHHIYLAAPGRVVRMPR